MTRLVLLLLLAKSSVATGDVEIHDILEGVEARQDLVDGEGHDGVSPESSAELVVSDGGEDLLDVGLGSGDGEGGAAELGELGDDVEGCEGLEEDSVGVVLGVHGRSPVVQESLGGGVDGEEGAGGEEGGAGGDVQDETTLLVQHGGQDGAGDEEGGLNVDAAQVADEGIVDEVEILGVGVADTNVVDEETDVLAFQSRTQTLIISGSSVREVNAHASSLTLSA